MTRLSPGTAVPLPRILVCTLTAVVLTLFLPTLVAGDTLLYSEDFTTTTYRDPDHTTADWNTADGELKLLPFQPFLVGNYNTPGNAYGVALAGGHAFVADAGAGLKIVDIRDPAAPTLAGTYDTPGSAGHVVVSGALAFVADGSGGLQIVDIANPAAPMPVGNYSTPNANGVAVAGNLAYVTDYDSGLLIMDISNPAAPTLLATFETMNSPRSVAVSGSLVIVAVWSSGIQIVDTSDPAAPTLVSTFDTAFAVDVAVSGDQVYVADYLAGLKIVDITDPAVPTLLGAYDTAGFANEIAVSGNRAFVADATAGLQVVDITDPTEPTLLRTFDTPSSAFAVAAWGNRAYVADGSSGLQIVQISNRVPPMFAGIYDTPNNAKRVEISGNLALVADGITGLQIVDITDPAAPTLLGTHNVQADAGYLAVSGDLVVVSDATAGFQIVDITNPASPMLLGSWDLPSHLAILRGVALSGNLVLVTDNFTNLHILDISNPAAPTLMGTYETSESISEVTVSGDYAFVSGGYSSGLKIINIADPTSPTLVGSYYPMEGGISRVVLWGHLALLSCVNSGLEIVDISDPAMPTLVGSLDTPNGAADLAVSGDVVLVMDPVSGIHFMDISDPSAPTLFGVNNPPGYRNGLAVSGDLAFVCNDIFGLRILQFTRDDFLMFDNVGHSQTVDEADDTIFYTRLTTTQTAGISWEVSSNAGGDWLTIDPTGTWTRLPTPGTDLVWRSAHTTPPFSENPTVSDLTLDWLTEKAPIKSIIDVPDDQGGRVDLSLKRSGYDFVDEPLLPVVGYAIYRRVDDETSVARILATPEPTGDEPRDGPAVKSYGADRVRLVDDRMYVLGSSEKAVGEFPPGLWEGVSWMLPSRSDEYTARVHTLADSTAAGTGWSVYLTAVHTESAEIWFASEPDSGYSVDNIAPAAPSALTADYAESGVTLDWADSPELDFQYYRVYRSTDSGFVPSPADLVHETAVSGWVDSSEELWEYHYQVTALDLAGNESEGALPHGMSGVGEHSTPERTVLMNAVPNPFNPSTVLAFELGAPGHTRLKIYDAAGRLVTTLVDEYRDAGKYQVRWDGRDDHGRLAAAGVYLYRMESGGVGLARRMVLVK